MNCPRLFDKKLFRGAIFKKSMAMDQKMMLNKVYGDFFTHGAGEVFAKPRIHAYVSYVAQLLTCDVPGM